MKESWKYGLKYFRSIERNDVNILLAGNEKYFMSKCGVGQKVNYFFFAREVKMNNLKAVN